MQTGFLKRRTTVSAQGYDDVSDGDDCSSAPCGPSSTHHPHLRILGGLLPTEPPVVRVQRVVRHSHSAPKVRHAHQRVVSNLEHADECFRRWLECAHPAPGSGIRNSGCGTLTVANAGSGDWTANIRYITVEYDYGAQGGVRAWLPLLVLLLPPALALRARPSLPSY